jgi:hypothetical protein
MYKLVVIIAVLLGMYKCSSDRSPPDILPHSQYEHVDVDVLFWFPPPRDDRVYNLGTVHGTSSCRRVALNYVVQHHLENNGDWSYVCCTHEGGSSCYRKIR